jgi:hypothetical protein
MINLAIGTILSLGCPNLERLNSTTWLQIFVDLSGLRHSPGIWNSDTASEFLKILRSPFLSYGCTYWRFYWSRDIIGQMSPFTRSSVTDRSVHCLLRVKSFVVWTGSAAVKFVRFQMISWFVSETCLNVVNPIRHSHCSVAVCPFEAWNPITHYFKIHIVAVYCEIHTKNTHTHAYILCVCVRACLNIRCAQNAKIFNTKQVA